jgi:hypothetical protein
LVSKLTTELVRERRTNALDRLALKRLHEAFEEGKTGGDSSPNPHP